MYGMPTTSGNRVLEETFRVGPSTGILPFRVVMLETDTLGVGNAAVADVKHPSASAVSDASEWPLGVAVDPAKPKNWVNDASYSPTSLWDAFVATAQYRQVTVRLMGTVPIMCDDTTESAPIVAGKPVSCSESSTTTISSTTVTMAGTVKVASYTSNGIAATERPVGIALHAVAPATEMGRYVLTLLRPWSF
jgi:hypothetical protein